MRDPFSNIKEKVLLPSQADLITPFVFSEASLYLLDQRLLPREKIFKAKDHVEAAKAIKSMVVRGAPAIGITASIGYYLGLKSLISARPRQANKNEIQKKLRLIYKTLSSTRPTAVNLHYALREMDKVAQDFLNLKPKLLTREELSELLASLRAKALNLWEQEVLACIAMGEHGKDLIPEGGVLTHCNTGALATGGYGTALGVIRASFAQGKSHIVYVDETRPFLQGTRLTAWELSKVSIPYRVIIDSSAGPLMQRGLIKAVIVGADRIAANGDTANKIGTYSLAVLAWHHGIPFYVAAPSSTFDLRTRKGSEIPIEERSEREVLSCGGKLLSPKSARALNLAFDVTPAELITGFITEKGIIHPPFEENLSKNFAQGKP